VFAALIVNVETVKLWPAVNDTLSTIMSAAEVPTVPWMWHVAPVLSWIRKCAAVPLASALVSCQVPFFDFDALDAAAIQSDGRLTVARTVPELDAAQFAGADPVRIVKIGDVPAVVSIASRRALLTVTEY
jgi:hypothetical protein